MSRQNSNYFVAALSKALGAANLKKIQQVTVGIAGAGGLGSNCAVNLVRSGFRKFVIVDFDKIDYSNLNRQFYFYEQVGRSKVQALKENLLRINPDLELEVYEEKIEKHNIEARFAKCDIMVEAFDQAIYKKMLVEHYSNQDKLIVSASGIAGFGKSDDLKTHKITEKLYIIGDLYSEVSNDLPPCAPRVAIVAAKQADVILAHVLRSE